MTGTDLLVVDADHRRRALTPDSFIVEAPAGAGKTELLTQRVLMLLAGVQEPEEVVAITFTNKAAAEMRHRIVDALQRAARAELPAEPHRKVTFDLATAALANAARRGWRLLDHPGRLRVTTIDAFCAGLARQMPVLSRFGGEPRPVEDARRHYEEAARRALAWLETDGELADAVSVALTHVDNDAEQLVRLVADMLARREQWLGHALASRETPVRAAEAALRELVGRDLRRGAEALPPALQRALMPVARFAAGNLDNDHPLARLRQWTRPLRTEADELPLWQAVVQLLLTDKGERRKALNVRLGFPAKTADAYKEALLGLSGGLADADVAALERLRRLPDPAYRQDEWATVEALATLLRIAAAELWQVFHAAGEVDFVEVAMRALQALGEPQAPTDLALALDYRIRHLLVDEFQDTSPAQVELLRRLTADWQGGDGRTLFLVGDPMQSIYRFRKADVGLFLNAANGGIGTLPLERLTLYRNNRSCAAVVDWVNATFARVFASRDDAAAGAIAYRQSAPTREALPGCGVSVHALFAARGEGGEPEARRILDIIDAERMADPGRRIAVLVRARSHLEALVALIRRSRPDLRFKAIEIDSLAQRQAVQDLLALTLALYHLADRVNWLAVLRAPWCGLRLADLHALAGDDFDATVWSLLGDDRRLDRLSDDGRERALHVRAALADVLRQRGRQRPGRWLMGAWLALGGPACLGTAADLADCEAFFALVERLDAAGRFSADELVGEMARLFGAPDGAADDRLQLMTLHKAKGLEFDTVVLPGLHRRPNTGDAPLMRWEEVILDDGSEHLVAAPLKRRGRKDGTTPYDYLTAFERERAAHEAVRMLYVAATRAVRHLHLVGVAQSAANGDVRPPAGTFLDVLWPAVGHHFTQANPAAEPVVETIEGFVARLYRCAEPPVLDMLPATAGAAAVTAGDGDEDASGRSLEARIGSLTHLYLEMIAREGLAAWPVARPAGLRGAMEVWLSQQGCGDRDAALGAERVVAMLSATLASDDGRWLLGSLADATAELALVRAEADGSSRHVVDRSFVDGGVRWIVDYKTADVAGDFAAHAERYRPQLERYGALFAAEGLPIRLAVYYVAPARLVLLT